MRGRASKAERGAEPRGGAFFAYIVPAKVAMAISYRSDYLEVNSSFLAE